MARKRLKPASLVVKKGNQVISLQEEDEFFLEDSDICCAYISPPLQIGKTRVDVVHFRTLTFLKNSIDFEWGFVPLNPGIEYTIKINDPSKYFKSSFNY